MQACRTDWDPAFWQDCWIVLIERHGNFHGTWARGGCEVCRKFSRFWDSASVFVIWIFKEEIYLDTGDVNLRNRFTRWSASHRKIFHKLIAPESFRSPWKKRNRFVLDLVNKKRRGIYGAIVLIVFKVNVGGSELVIIRRLQVFVYGMSYRCARLDSKLYLSEI